MTQAIYFNLNHKKLTLFTTIILLSTTITAIILLCATKTTFARKPFSISRDRSRLFNVNLSSLTHEELHRLVILDQIDRYIQPIRSLKTRQALSLDGLYDFCFDPQTKGFEDGWQDSELSKQCSVDNFYRMPVPSAFNEIVPNSTAKDYMGWFWYQTNISPSMIFASSSDAEQSNHRWLLQFDNVNYMTVIWLKDEDKPATSKAQLIGAHVGGHLPIVLEVTNLISQRSIRGYKLTLAVSNMLTSETIPSGQMIDLSSVVGHNYKQFKPDFDFFHYSGVMGNVNLVKLPVNYISSGYFKKNSSSINLEVCLSANYQGGDRFEVDRRLKLNISFNDHSVMYRLPARPIITSTQQQAISDYYTRKENCLDILVCVEDECSDLMASTHFDQTNKSRLRRFQPARVELIAETLGEGGRYREQREDLFEIKFQLPPMVVGEGTMKKQLQGFGMHHEQLFSGRTMSLSSIMKDMYLLKKLGANLIRTSHYPYSEAYLDACDEMGLMVIAECPAVGLKSFSEIKLTLHKQILLEMMQRDYHHSSIVMWSVANEPESQHNEAQAYFQKLLQYARSALAKFTVEANRPLTAAIAQSHEDDKIGQSLDIIMVNRYYGWYDYTGALETIRPALVASLAGWARKYNNKPLILSEFGADTIAGLHKPIGGQLFSEEYQRDLLVEYERVFDELFQNRSSTGGINFLGAMIWNFADFSTHNSLLRVGGNKKGIFTQSREPKLAVESIEKIFKSRL